MIRCEPGTLRCGRFRLDLSRPLVMAIVNVTPDSFSDGGVNDAPGAAIEAAQRSIDEGAAIVDLGGESTRPGASAVAADDEWTRLAPVLRALRDAPVPISVDTRKPDVMRRALDAGASMINDVAGFGSADARLAVAASDAALCVMHMQGDPASMQQAPHYDDVVGEVLAFLDDRVQGLVDAGVAGDRIVIDPGFGFGKTLAHNLALFRSLDRFAGGRWPVLVGLSRKGMIGTLTGRPVGERLAGSVAAALLAIMRGAAIVRVHDVVETVDALAVLAATQESGRAADR